MSNVLGTSFAQTGFSYDPNLSPYNQSFSYAVRAVLLANLQSALIPLGTGYFANPSAKVALTGTNGTSTLAMRADAAPPLDTNISPTWAGVHTFSGTSTGPVLVTVANGVAAVGANPTGMQVSQLSGTAVWGVWVQGGTNTTASNFAGFTMTAGNAVMNSSDFEIYLTGDQQAVINQLANQSLSLRTNNNNRIQITGSGQVTVLAPAAGTSALIVGGVSNNAAPSLKVNDGSTFQLLAQNASVASSGGDYPFFGYNMQATNVAGSYKFFSTDHIAGFQIGPSATIIAKIQAAGTNTAGSVATFASPLTIAVAPALALVGTAAGTPAIQINTSHTTGTTTATFTTATNKPGSTSGAVAGWLPIRVDGVIRYIPTFA